MVWYLVASLKITRKLVGYSLVYLLVAHKRILLRIWGQNYEIILNNGAILAQKKQNDDK